MKLKRGTSTRRPAGSASEAPRSTPAAMWRRWTTILILVIALGAALLVWPVGPRRAPVEPLTLPANLDQLEGDVAQLIRAKAARVEADPDDAALYGDVGMVYEANQLWNDAREAYRRAVGLQPDDRNWRLHLAMALQEVGDFPAALTQLRSLAETDPAFAPAQQRLGVALLETGEWDAARTAFESVIQLAPQAAEGYVGLARVWLGQGDAAQAARTLEQALTIDSHDAVAHHLLGTAYARLGREQEAAEHLAMGLDATVHYLPDPLTSRLADYAVNAKARLVAGGRQLANGQTELAVRTLQQVLQVEPHNVSAMNNLAVAYVRQQRLEDAHQLLLKAVQIDPHKYLSYINLSNWAKTTGSDAQALQFAERAVELAPQVDITHRTRAVSLAQAGRIEEALASAARAATLNPRDPRTQSLCADLCLRLHRYAEAASYFRRTTELSPDRVEAWLGLAKASLAAGDRQEAAKALERARHLAPHHADIQKVTEQLRVRATGPSSVRE